MIDNYVIKINKNENRFIAYYSIHEVNGVNICVRFEAQKSFKTTQIIQVKLLAY